MQGWLTLSFIDCSLSTIVRQCFYISHGNLSPIYVHKSNSMTKYSSRTLVASIVVASPFAVEALPHYAQVCEHEHLSAVCLATASDKTQEEVNCQDWLRCHAKSSALMRVKRNQFWMMSNRNLHLAFTVFGLNANWLKHSPLTTNKYS